MCTDERVVFTQRDKAEQNSCYNCKQCATHPRDKALDDEEQHMRVVGTTAWLKHNCRHVLLNARAMLRNASSDNFIITGLSRSYYKHKIHVAAAGQPAFCMAETPFFNK